MKNEDIVKWLRSKKVETGSLLCLGCGHENNCGIHGCAVMRAAADAMENLQTENAAIRRQIENLTSAQAVMVKELDKKLEELAQVKAERDAAVSDIEKIAKGGKTWMCPYCKHGRDTGYGFADCEIQLGGCKVPFTMFEWRGPQKEM